MLGGGKDGDGLWSICFLKWEHGGGRRSMVLGEGGYALYLGLLEAEARGAVRDASPTIQPIRKRESHVRKCDGKLVEAVVDGILHGARAALQLSARTMIQEERRLCE